MTAYYNENDPFAAQWLRNLISKGLIAQGEVDERSIEDVCPSDISGFTQCHFFAGIGVWSYALRQAGWPDDRPVWTGSCPCQSFSSAGKGAGFADERHLWPAFFHLIEQCKPPTIFGEQVETAVKHAWLDLVQDDMEGIGYAFGSVCAPAAGVGAPHIRSRLFWVANTKGGRFQRCRTGEKVQGQKQPERLCNAYGLVHTDSNRCCEGDQTTKTARHGHSTDSAGWTYGFWADVDWLPCKDGKWRPTEPGIFPLANGVAARVGRLRGYGNAIVAPLATEFIKACKLD